MEQTELINKIIEEYDTVMQQGISGSSPYLQELINNYQHFAITSNMVGVICCGIILIVSAIFLIHIIAQLAHKNNESIYIDDYNTLNVLGFTVAFCCIIFSAIAFPLLICGIYSVIGWINFPEIQLLKEIMQN